MADRPTSDARERRGARNVGVLGSDHLILEGFYDWTVIGNCAYMYSQDACRY